jgi:TIR domain
LSATRRLRIFLNYRREETSGHAGRLYDALAARFGDDRVFMDIDRIEPGLDFTQVISEAVAGCDVVISVIGSRWLTSEDNKGRRRIENPEDFVRLELEAALERDVRVIPALVQNAEMPQSDELPDRLQPFARRHAVELSDTRWAFDVGKLIGALERLEAQLAEPEALQARTEAPRRDEVPPGRSAESAPTSPEQPQPKPAARGSDGRPTEAPGPRLERHERRGIALGRVPIRSWVMLGSAIVALAGSLAPWGTAYYDEDVAFIPSFRIPVVALMVAAVVLVAASTRRRSTWLLVTLIVVAGVATGLSSVALARVYRAEDSTVEWGMFVALVGAGSLLLTSAVAARRARARGQARFWVAIERGVVVAIATLGLVGAGIPWIHIDGSMYDEDVAFVPGFRIPVIILVALAAVLLLAFTRRRTAFLAGAAAVATASAVAVAAVAVIKVRRVDDEYFGVQAGRGAYLALAGACCLFLLSVFVAVRSLRARVSHVETA